MNKPNFDNITYLRICLFDNATPDELVLNKRKYKVTIGAKLSTSNDFFNFSFGMNTRGTWALRRGKLFEEGLCEDSHYKTLVHNYHEIKKSADWAVVPRCSKAYSSNGRNKIPVPFVSAVLWGDETNYFVNLMMGDRQWTEQLSASSLTAAEQKHNMIAKTTWTTATSGVFDWSKTSWV